MSTTYQTGFKTTLALPLAAADTSMTVATAPTITSGRLFIQQGNIKEWVSFTGVSGTSITGLTRGLSQTADPATAGTGSDFIAGATVKIVAMHDQLQDKQYPVATVYADTTARDAALGGDGAATEAYTDVYTTAEGLHRNYNLSSNQWESVDTGTTTPNASTTSAGKGELPTQAESDAGTATGGTGAALIGTPETTGRSVQAGAWVYDEDTGAADAYVVTLTPAPTAYTEGMKISVKIGVGNTSTGASTINVNSLGAKAIQDRDGGAIIANQLVAGQVYDLLYDGTQFRLITIEKASDAEVTTGTDTIKYITPNQLPKVAILQTTRTIDAASGDVDIAHGLSRTPKYIIATMTGGDTNHHNTSTGYSDGSTHNCSYTGGNSAGTWVQGNSSGKVIYWSLVSSGSPESQSATASFDSTNVTLTRTKVGSGSGETCYVTIMAFA